MKTLVALSRTDWFRLSVYIICKLCNQCPLLSIFKLLFVCDGNVLFAFALCWEIFNLKHSERPHKKGRAIWKQTLDTQNEHSVDTGPQRAVVCREMVLPSVRLHWGGLCPIMLCSLWGLHPHHRWCWGADGPDNHKRNLDIYLYSFSVLLGSRCFLGSLLPPVFSGPMPQRICDASD